MMEIVLVVAIILALVFYKAIGFFEMLYLTSLVLFWWHLAVLTAELLLLILVSLFIGVGTGLLGIDSAKTKIGKLFSFWGYGILIGGLSGTALTLIFWRIFLPNVMMVAGFYLINKGILHWPIEMERGFNILNGIVGIILISAAVWLKMKNKKTES